MKNWTETEFRNLLAFLVLMQGGDGLMKKSPEYILEKFHRYVGQDLPEWKWGMDVYNIRTFKAYVFMWTKHLNFNDKQNDQENNQENNGGQEAPKT